MTEDDLTSFIDGENKGLISTTFGIEGITPSWLDYYYLYMSHFDTSPSAKRIIFINKDEALGALTHYYNTLEIPLETQTFDESMNDIDAIMYFKNYLLSISYIWDAIVFNVETTGHDIAIFILLAMSVAKVKLGIIKVNEGSLNAISQLDGSLWVSPISGNSYFIMEPHKMKADELIIMAIDELRHNRGFHFDERREITTLPQSTWREVIDAIINQLE